MNWHDDYMKQREIEKRLANEIDTGWYSSWHWDKTEGGYLTPKGWQQALADAERNALAAREDADRREAFLLELRPVVQKIVQDAVRGRLATATDIDGAMVHVRS